MLEAKVPGRWEKWAGILVPGFIGSQLCVRVGDVIHCVADIGKIRNALGFAPQVTLDSGCRI